MSLPEDPYNRQRGGQVAAKHTHLFGGDVEVGLEGQCGLEPPTILLHKVEVHGTHQPLVLI